MYGDKLRAYINIPAALPQEPIIIGSTAICILIVVVTVLVILLSMTLLIKTVIIRKQQEFGIKKSLGFTSSQLRKELVLSMMPCVIIGSSVGAVIGTLKSNAFLTALLGSLGLAESRLPVYGWMGISSVIFTTLISAVIIWLLSSKIKKISAYSLIKE
jgi:predicted lysophospholipase L1 biosynthesis ABC-type transport system permease subunit